MKQCHLYCVTTETEIVADVMEETDKRIKVVINDTDITVVLTRSDGRRPYIGHVANLEFETFGELE